MAGKKLTSTPVHDSLAVCAAIDPTVITESKKCNVRAVSYTHLDVYKRQAFSGNKRGLCRNCCIYFIYNKGNVVAEICENRKLIFNAETEQTAIKAICSVVFYSLALLNLSFAVLNISIVSCTRFKGEMCIRDRHRT